MFRYSEQRDPEKCGLSADGRGEGCALSEVAAPRADDGGRRGSDEME